jgi:pre-rRNA-processing protein TSR1
VPGCTSNLVSKESVFFHCGFRRFISNPIYSEDSLNADKYKYLKSVKDENPVVASIYAPAMFKTANLLVFKETMEGHELVAKGNLVSFDPKRLVIKRILLTGYPIKVIFI